MLATSGRGVREAVLDFSLQAYWQMAVLRGYHRLLVTPFAWPRMSVTHLAEVTPMLLNGLRTGRCSEGEEENEGGARGNCGKQVELRRRRVDSERGN